jgi:hypothetical protein
MIAAVVMVTGAFYGAVLCRLIFLPVQRTWDGNGAGALVDVAMMRAGTVTRADARRSGRCG